MSDPTDGSDPQFADSSRLDPDSSRQDPVERLYRRPAGEPQSRRPGAPTHFQPALTPPEGDPNADDQYGWLYRVEPEPEPEAPEQRGPFGPDTEVRDPEAQPDHREPSSSYSPDIEAVAPEMNGNTAGAVGLGQFVQFAPTQPDGGEPAETQAGSGVAPPSQPPLPGPVSPAPVHKRRRRALLLVAIPVVIVMVVIALLVANLVRVGNLFGVGGAGRNADPSQGSTPGTSTGSVPDGDAPYTGEVGAVSAAEASADCVAPPATDAGGAEVTYQPELTADGDPNTAWRCDGNGLGKSLTLNFPDGTQLAEVGLINGYAKVDPATGDERYGEYRRITEVTWTLPNGTSIEQTLEPEDDSLQVVRIPATTTNSITLTIESSTKPGTTAPTRDAVLISEVGFGTPTG